MFLVRVAGIIDRHPRNDLKSQLRCKKINQIRATECRSLGICGMRFNQPSSCCSSQSWQFIKIHFQIGNYRQPRRWPMVQPSVAQLPPKQKNALSPIHAGKHTNGHVARNVLNINGSNGSLMQGERRNNQHQCPYRVRFQDKILGLTKIDVGHS